ncbi:regulatory protein RecX [Porphyromonas endodontalis]|uniref:regulatory protein RecX n=1 Tax=Porphyromonas endodontalis TaxID=28124 RepID=UPI00361101F0
MTPENLYRKVSSYCSSAERCPAEVAQWLWRHGIDAEDHSFIIEKLKADNFINEERFIHAFASDKLRFSGWGPFKIKQELLQRDLPEGAVERIVREVMDEEDAPRLLREMLTKKLLSLVDPTPDEIQRKVITWAMNRGFDLDEILSILKEF